MSVLVERSSRRRLAALAGLVVSSMFGVSLVFLRSVWTGELHYGNLLWNLVLAWIPFLVALVLYDRSRRGSRGISLLLPALVWLAFLPNAPYLVTEFGLLRVVDGMPVWFDVAMLTTFAWSGLLLGFVSVYLVQQVVARSLGAASGWLVAAAALGLSGVGIYLGRVLRLNSWDLLLQPHGVLAELRESVTTPRMVGMSLVMGTFLLVAYGMLYTFLQAAVDERR